MNENADKTERRRKITVAVIVLSAILLAFLVSAFIFRVSIISGDSMKDTLRDGDVVLFSPRDCYESGDIIVFKREALARGTIVKRIIAVPGDRISIDDGDIYINGVFLLNTGCFDELSEITIPEDGFFVIGDNYGFSTDSRHSEMGLVDRNEICGKVIFRLFPKATAKL